MLITHAQHQNTELVIALCYLSTERFLVQCWLVSGIHCSCGYCVALSVQSVPSDHRLPRQQELRPGVSQSVADSVFFIVLWSWCSFHLCFFFFFICGYHLLEIKPHCCSRFVSYYVIFLFFVIYIILFIIARKWLVLMNCW